MATASTLNRQAEFFREFLMARGKFDPRDFGVDMEREEFVDRLVDAFNTKFRGMMTVDELVVHPREALDFCDEVRRHNGWYLVPDDIILRSVLNRRKNP